MILGKLRGRADVDQRLPLGLEFVQNVIDLFYLVRGLHLLFLFS